MYKEEKGVAYCKLHKIVISEGGLKSIHCLCHDCRYFVYKKKGEGW